jgi:SPP1 family predicted phage head-tail adaptor
MSISRGLFNHTLTLQRKTVTSDGQGGNIETWADVGNFRGRVSSLSADERVSMGKVNVFPTHKIFCDNLDIIETDRILWGSYVFNITGILNPSEMYHHLEILVLEVV